MYKKEAAKVAALLAKVPAQEVADAMQREGYFMVENYGVKADQVDISRKKQLFAAHVLFRMLWNPVLALTGCFMWL